MAGADRESELVEATSRPVTFPGELWKKAAA